MSETNKKTESNLAIACADLKVSENRKEIKVEQGKYGPSRKEVNQLAGMEIKWEDSTVTNETPDGRVAILDKSTGKVIGYLEGDGTVSRKLEAKDRKAAKSAKTTKREEEAEK